MVPPVTKINLEQIAKARRLFARHFPVTRLQIAPWVSRMAGVEVALKLEIDQPTGSFKVRGALYALAANLERTTISEVVTASTGNHGAAVAYAASRLKVPCTVFLPDHPNPTKLARIIGLGAKVVEAGSDLSQAAALASAHATRNGAYFLNDATDPDLPAGPATIACEVLEQRPETDAFVIPVGDTAFIRGIAAAVRHLRPEILVIGVQATGAPAYYEAWKTGKPVTDYTPDTIADGLASQIPDARNVTEIRELIDGFCLVSDDELLETMLGLILEERVLSEPAGAAATAALVQKKLKNVGKRPTAVVSGANISPQLLHRLGSRVKRSASEQ